MTQRRVVFNLEDFLFRLEGGIKDSPEDIHDAVEEYKTFLKRLNEPLLNSVKEYVNGHFLVLEDQKVRSYIEYCHKLVF